MSLRTTCDRFCDPFKLLKSVELSASFWPSIIHDSLKESHVLNKVFTTQSLKSVV